MEPDNRAIFESYYGENFVFPFASVTSATAEFVVVYTMPVRGVLAPVTEAKGNTKFSP